MAIDDTTKRLALCEKAMRRVDAVLALCEEAKRVGAEVDVCLEKFHVTTGPETREALDLARARLRDVSARMRLMAAGRPR